MVGLLLISLVAGCSVPAGPSEPATDVVPSVSTASPIAGCTPPDLPRDTAPDMSEVTGMRTQPIAAPLLASGSQVDGLSDPSLAALRPVLLPTSPDALPVQVMIAVGGSGSMDGDPLPDELITIYSKSPVSATATAYDVIGQGGAIFIQSMARGQDATAVLDTIGARATIIRVGDHDAAVVESSTLPTGVRSHNVFWSDGRLDYSLRIAGSSQEAVKVAQSIYCS